MTAVSLVVAVLATYRLTRLVVQDYLTEGPRRWVQAHTGEKIAYLAGCPWCASVWVGAAVSAAVTFWPTNRVVLAGLLALAASGATGLIAAHLDPPEDYGDTDEAQAAE